MSLFSQVRRALKEVVLVTTADVDDELITVRKIQDRLSSSTHYITSQQTVYKDRLAGF